MGLPKQSYFLFKYFFLIPGCLACCNCICRPGFLIVFFAHMPIFKRTTITSPNPAGTAPFDNLKNRDPESSLHGHFPDRASISIFHNFQKKMRIMQRYLLTLSAFKYLTSVNGFISLSEICIRITLSLLFSLH